MEWCSSVVTQAAVRSKEAVRKSGRKMLSNSQVNCETANLLLEDFSIVSGTETAFVKEICKCWFCLEAVFWSDSSNAREISNLQAKKIAKKQDNVNSPGN